MNYVFDYEEIRTRRFNINADNLKDALENVYDKIDNIKWGDDDFYCGEIRMPMDKNFLPYLKSIDNDEVINKEDTDIVVDMW